MAEISTSGLEELLSDMEAIAEIPDATILEMLTAEAEVIAPAQAAEARAMGVVDTGITARSITFDKKLKETKDGKAIYVYPQGSRSDGAADGWRRSLSSTSLAKRASPRDRLSERQTRERETRPSKRRRESTTNSQIQKPIRRSFYGTVWS